MNIYIHRMFEPGKGCIIRSLALLILAFYITKIVDNIITKYCPFPSVTTCQIISYIGRGKYPTPLASSTHPNSQRKCYFYYEQTAFLIKTNDIACQLTKTYSI